MNIANTRSAKKNCRKNKIYLLRSSSKFRLFGYIPGNIMGAISLFLYITGAIAPVLNTPLHNMTKDCSLNYKFNTLNFQAQKLQNVKHSLNVNGLYYLNGLLFGVVSLKMRVYAVSN